jgi:5-methylthioribose kinase
MDTIFDDRKRVVLCPSCAFIGKIAFAIGALIAGALVKFFG